LAALGPPKMHSKRHLLQKGDVHESIVKPSEDLDFSPSWPLLGALGRLLATLGRSWASIGLLLAALGLLLGRPNALKANLLQKGGVHESMRKPSTNHDFCPSWPLLRCCWVLLGGSWLALADLGSLFTARGPLLVSLGPLLVPLGSLLVPLGPPLGRLGPHPRAPHSTAPKGPLPIYWSGDSGALPRLVGRVVGSHTLG